LGGLALVLRAILEPVADTDALDDEHLVLKLHVSLSLGLQLASAGVDSARLQRATQGAGQSTGRRRDHVVECGGVVWEQAGRSAVVFPDLIVGSEEDWLRLDRQVGSPDRTT